MAYRWWKNTCSTGPVRRHLSLRGFEYLQRDAGRPRAQFSRRADGRGAGLDVSPGWRAAALGFSGEQHAHKPLRQRPGPLGPGGHYPQRGPGLAGYRRQPDHFGAGQGRDRRPGLRGPGPRPGPGWPEPDLLQHAFATGPRKDAGQGGRTKERRFLLDLPRAFGEPARAATPVAPVPSRWWRRPGSDRLLDLFV